MRIVQSHARDEHERLTANQFVKSYSNSSEADPTRVRLMPSALKAVSQELEIPPDLRLTYSQWMNVYDVALDTMEIGTNVQRNLDIQFAAEAKDVSPGEIIRASGATIHEMHVRYDRLREIKVLISLYAGKKSLTSSEYAVFFAKGMNASHIEREKIESVCSALTDVFHIPSQTKLRYDQWTHIFALTMELGNVTAEVLGGTGKIDSKETVMLWEDIDVDDETKTSYLNASREIHRVISMYTGNVMDGSARHAVFTRGFSQGKEAERIKQDSKSGIVVTLYPENQRR